MREAIESSVSLKTGSEEKGKRSLLHQPLEASLALGFCCDYFQTLRGKFKGPGPTSDGAPSGGVVLKYKHFGSSPLPDFKLWDNQVSEHFLKPSSGRILLLGCKAVRAN